MKVFALLLLPSLCAAAAPPASIDGVIDRARAASPEFASDALIRIAATGQVDRSRKIELLEDAFRRASGAQHAYKRRSALSRLDGQSAYWNRVYAQDLDGLTLRLRAVSAMLPLDGAKARELFIQIPPIRIPRVTCDDFLVYDVARFYEVLGDFARQNFSAKEVQAGAPFQLLRSYAGSITSPVEVGPLARVIGAASLADAEFQGLLAAFAGALGKVAGDDRAFTYSHSVGKDIEALVEEAKRRHVSPLPLLEAYRLYLVVNLSAARCADDDLMQGGQQSFGVFTTQAAAQQTADYVTFFNTRLRMPPLQPIVEQEATPSRLAGAATGLRFCQNGPCRAISGKFRELMLNANGMPYPPGERNRPEWQARLQAFLSTMAEWKPAAGVTAAEYFEEKTQVYGDLLNLTADGPSREPVLRALLDFADRNEYQKSDRVEWFRPVNALIGRLSLDPLGLGKFADEVRKAKDPVIALYADLESVAPRTPDRIMPLL